MTESNKVSNDDSSGLPFHLFESRNKNSQRRIFTEGNLEFVLRKFEDKSIRGISFKEKSRIDKGGNFASTKIRQNFDERSMEGSIQKKKKKKRVTHHARHTPSPFEIPFPFSRENNSTSPLSDPLSIRKTITKDEMVRVKNWHERLDDCREKNPYGR